MFLYYLRFRTPLEVFEHIPRGSCGATIINKLWTDCENFSTHECPANDLLHNFLIILTKISYYVAKYVIFLLLLCFPFLLVGILPESLFILLLFHPLLSRLSFYYLLSSLPSVSQALLSTNSLFFSSTY